MTQIHKTVAENRRRVKTSDARFIEAGERGVLDLAFSRNSVTVDVTIEIYKRNLNDGLISGHPNGSKHGSGQGVSGDVRGPWTLVESTTTSEAWTTAGRNGVRDALDGANWSVDEGSIGTGTSTATAGDTALDSKSEQVRAISLKDSPEVVRGRSLFGFADHDNVATEFGLYDTSGDLIARATTDDINPTDEEEVRVGIILTVNGYGVGKSVVTNDGEERIADAIHATSSTVGLLEFAWGTGTTEFQKSDSSLTSEFTRERFLREKQLEALRVERTLPGNTGTEVDLSEVAVYDNANNMIWATTFDPFTYGSETQFSTAVGFKFR